ncbi:MAG TPA: Ig-like domain-containing protein, partial [Chitinophagaceae bacterium]|nr:Ig-like domain-containing protein [Chitinophagaceae bacterium]
MGKHALFFLLFLVVVGCNKPGEPAPTPVPPSNFAIKSWMIGGSESVSTNIGLTPVPDIKLRFGARIDKSTVASSISITANTGGVVNYTTSYENADSVVVIRPTATLGYLSRYRVNATTSLKSAEGGRLNNSFGVEFMTRIDSSRKFPAISDDSLLTLVQKQSFRYFWDFAHPVSGLARDRTTSGDLVTSGGSGFGIMAIPVAVSRGFITRAQALARMQTIVGFLKTAEKFHGA